MKKAFTLVELIFVIIIASILAYFAANKFEKDTLTPASYQLLDHIKYTQSLALDQDMFVSSPYFATYTQSDAQKEMRKSIKPLLDKYGVDRKMSKDIIASLVETFA